MYQMLSALPEERPQVLQGSRSLHINNTTTTYGALSNSRPTMSRSSRAPQKMVWPTPKRSYLYLFGYGLCELCDKEHSTVVHFVLENRTQLPSPAQNEFASIFCLDHLDTQPAPRFVLPQTSPRAVAEACGRANLPNFFPCGSTCTT